MTKKGEEANQPLRRRRGVGDFESLVPKQKPHGGFHPAATMGWKFEPRAHRLETNALTEYSDAVVFAWEFLRRNRFYMALVDKKYPRIPETEWGFQYSKKSARTHGLLEVKPYTEHYHEGRPPAWIGLDTFAQRLQSQSICTKPQSLNIELQGEQLVVVLDLGKYFHRSPWREQLFALQDFLEEWERKKYRDKPPEIGRLHKKVLLRRIRLIDFLSRGKNLKRQEFKPRKCKNKMTLWQKV